MAARNPYNEKNLPAYSSRSLQLRPAKSPDPSYTFGNLVAVSPYDIAGDDRGTYVLLNGKYVLTARPLPQFAQDQIGLSDGQRTWMQISFKDVVDVEIYDPFSHGGQTYLGSMDVEVSFASKTKITDAPYDQDRLAEAFLRVFRNQIFAPGQQLLMDFEAIPLRLVVRTVDLVDLTAMKGSRNSTGPPKTSSDPNARGILTPETLINYFKDAKTGINLKGSTRRPAANSIVRPDFKFEDMGIGGLDKELSDIFRRAFASRIFPPGLVEKLGIQHVKGMLLYGPPGTGKTLIARQIGKMLNAREPKIINGPEVLNKYVGQSEENIRKLFADAEKEYKEKGEESGLHIIIFDELDAVCKQRGSGAGGGTGVGDSVVNQLLSKLDGVEQLNNILLIGMTNRKDMIDEALLRSGRLEVHMEISLPDENGRQQILKIHTTQMRNNNVMGTDVDIPELARRTRNYSGAELSGVVKCASSFAFSRHIKVGTAAAIDESVVNMKVTQADFLQALTEVKPLFGIAEDELSKCMPGGILNFSRGIESILTFGREYTSQVRSGASQLLTVLLHGRRGSGKTALAARIAMDSQFPFIKLLRPVDMAGMNELAKIQYLQKIFTDAYKSPLSALVLDDIELLIDWVPIGPRFSSSVLAALKAFMKNRPPQNHPLLVIATTSSLGILQQLELNFQAKIAVPEITRGKELEYVMRKSGAFEKDETASILSAIEASTGRPELGVGVDTVLTAITTARHSEKKVDRFVQIIAEAVLEDKREIVFAQ